MSMITIFLFSSEDASNSSNTSETLVKEVVGIVIKDDTKKEEKVESIVSKYMFYIRKSAHFIEYMLLGFLLVNLAKDYRNLSIWTISLCVAVACIYACTDEIHQLFVEGRAARIFDVGVDTTGGLIGGLIYYAMYNLFLKKRQISKN